MNDSPLRLEYVDPKTLTPNPANWRRHPQRQLATLSEVMGEVGWAGALLYNEANGHLIDGHARLALAGEEPVPVLVGSWSDEQEAVILATLDPLAAMAVSDQDALATLLASIDSEGAIADLLASLETPTAEDRLAEWVGMPEFSQRDKTAWKQIVVNLAEEKDLAAFGEAIGQNLTEHTRSIWFPPAEKVSIVNQRFVGDDAWPSRYPHYIVSKGRWESRLTHKALDAMGQAHYVVVEEQEREQYAAVLAPTATLLVLDKAYQAEYDCCDGLGDTKSKGPGPARNFVWDHAAAAGAERHWVMDDNIQGFYRLYRNMKVPAATPTIFRCMEDFVDRYDNVAMAGPQYFMFAARKAAMPPFVLNTRIYSCNLIRNDLSYRWRGRYNEDTDISLRMLKEGWPTVLFNAFLQLKSPTQTVAGGNTAEFYEKEGTLPKSEMQVRLHPDVSRLVWRFGRPHHYVDYSGFERIRLRPRPDAVIPETDPYGLTLQRRVAGEWLDVGGDDGPAD